MVGQAHVQLESSSRAAATLPATCTTLPHVDWEFVRDRAEELLVHARNAERDESLSTGGESSRAVPEEGLSSELALGYYVAAQAMLRNKRRKLDTHISELRHRMTLTISPTPPDDVHRCAHKLLKLARLAEGRKLPSSPSPPEDSGDLLSEVHQLDWDDVHHHTRLHVAQAYYSGASQLYPSRIAITRRLLEVKEDIEQVRRGEDAALEQSTSFRGNNDILIPRTPSPELSSQLRRNASSSSIGRDGVRLGSEVDRVSPVPPSPFPRDDFPMECLSQQSTSCSSQESESSCHEDHAAHHTLSKRLLVSPDSSQRQATPVQLQSTCSSQSSSVVVLGDQNTHSESPFQLERPLPLAVASDFSPIRGDSLGPSTPGTVGQVSLGSPESASDSATTKESPSSAQSPDEKPQLRLSQFAFNGTASTSLPKNYGQAERMQPAKKVVALPKSRSRKSKAEVEKAPPKPRSRKRKADADPGDLSVRSDSAPVPKSVLKSPKRPRKKQVFTGEPLDLTEIPVELLLPLVSCPLCPHAFLPRNGEKVRRKHIARCGAAMNAKFAESNAVEKPNCSTGDGTGSQPLELSLSPAQVQIEVTSALLRRMLEKDLDKLARREHRENVLREEQRTLMERTVGNVFGDTERQPATSTESPKRSSTGGRRRKDAPQLVGAAPKRTKSGDATSIKRKGPVSALAAKEALQAKEGNQVKPQRATSVVRPSETRGDTYGAMLSLLGFAPSLPARHLLLETQQAQSLPPQYPDLPLATQGLSWTPSTPSDNENCTTSGQSASRSEGSSFSRVVSSLAGCTVTGATQSDLVPFLTSRQPSAPASANTNNSPFAAIAQRPPPCSQNVPPPNAPASANVTVSRIGARSLGPGGGLGIDARGKLLRPVGLR